MTLQPPPPTLQLLGLSTLPLPSVLASCAQGFLEFESLPPAPATSLPSLDPGSGAQTCSHPYPPRVLFTWAGPLRPLDHAQYTHVCPVTEQRFLCKHSLSGMHTPPTCSQCLDYTCTCGPSLPSHPPGGASVVESDYEADPRSKITPLNQAGRPSDTGATALWTLRSGNCEPLKVPSRMTGWGQELSNSASCGRGETQG